MQNRNYPFPKVDPEWADSRGTHKAVAAAIHAISDSKRSADEIWEAPTPAEDDHVHMAVQEYVSADLIPYDPKGYNWGVSLVKVADPDKP